jgi:hypothetical protein
VPPRPYQQAGPMYLLLQPQLHSAESVVLLLLLLLMMLLLACWKNPAKELRRSHVFEFFLCSLSEHIHFRSQHLKDNIYSTQITQLS